MNNLLWNLKYLNLLLYKLSHNNDFNKWGLLPYTKYRKYCNREKYNFYGFTEI